MDVAQWEACRPKLSEIGWRLYTIQDRFAAALQDVNWHEAKRAFPVDPLADILDTGPVRTMFPCRSFAAFKMARAPGEAEMPVFFRCIPRPSRELDICKRVESLRKEPLNNTVPIRRFIDIDDIPGLSPVTFLVTEVGQSNIYSQYWDYLRSLRRIVEALVFLHSNGIAHLDPGPQNWLCQQGDPGSDSLMDFGNAVQTKGGVLVRDELELIDEARPPECAPGNAYDPFPVDIYILGYVIEAHLHPRWTVKFQYHVPEEEILELARRMQSSDPKKRPTASEVLQSVIHFQSLSNIRKPPRYLPCFDMTALDLSGPRSPTRDDSAFFDSPVQSPVVEHVLWSGRCSVQTPC